MLTFYHKLYVFNDYYFVVKKHFLGIFQGASSSKPGFAPPTETLEKSLETKINSSAVVMASEANVDGSEMINDQSNVAGGVLKTESDPQGE